MKTINQMTALCLFFLVPLSALLAQEDSVQRPAYVTVTTLHWNMDYEDFDMDTWKAVEKEYFDKVTSKNELVMGAGMYTHRFTPDSRELLVVHTYGSWEDIDKAGSRNSELVKEGWPDEEARKAFFKKRNAYYTNFHSDEIYAPMANAIPHDRKSTEILFVRRSHFKAPEDGSLDEFSSVQKEVVDQVYRKNEYIKGYYPNGHAWGSDNTEFVQAFFVNSVADLDAMFDRSGELFEAHWSDDAAQKEMDTYRRKYFTGVHGDYIYTTIPELIK